MLKLLKAVVMDISRREWMFLAVVGIITMIAYCSKGILLLLGRL